VTGMELGLENSTRSGLPPPKRTPNTGGDQVATITRPPGTGMYSVELDATLEAARAARLYVVGVLTGWDVPENIIDTARLLTSELASNASAHGQNQGGTFTLEVRSFGCCFGVDVADHSPDPPVVRSVEVDNENGRGLLLVEEVADSWGYYFGSGRKHVWFHLHKLAGDRLV
jgi:anti-sigma regulatory factor (Ser/Thr protein kinase)